MLRWAFGFTRAFRGRRRRPAFTRFHGLLPRRRTYTLASAGGYVHRFVRDGSSGLLAWNVRLAGGFFRRSPVSVMTAVALGEILPFLRGAPFLTTAATAPAAAAAPTTAALVAFALRLAAFSGGSAGRLLRLGRARTALLLTAAAALWLRRTLAAVFAVRVRMGPMRRTRTAMAARVPMLARRTRRFGGCLLFLFFFLLVENGADEFL